MVQKTPQDMLSFRARIEPANTVGLEKNIHYSDDDVLLTFVIEVSVFCLYDFCLYGSQ